MKTETRTIFIADDGTEFDNESDARRHEHIARMVDTIRNCDATLTNREALTATVALLAVGTFKFNY